MYVYKYSDKFKKILKKLSKKNKPLYEQVLKKIYEIINSYNMDAYKNLRFNMKDYKRVHVGHFVIVFEIDKNKNFISFENFDHHDNIYK